MCSQFEQEELSLISQLVIVLVVFVLIDNNIVIKQKAAAFSYANELTPPWKPYESHLSLSHLHIIFLESFTIMKMISESMGFFSTFLSFFFKFFKGHKQFANDQKSALLFGVWGIEFIGLMMHNKMMPAIRNQ